MSHDAGRADDCSEGSSLQDHSQWIETVPAQPDQGDAQRQEREAETRPEQARRDEQEFGAHAVEELHGGTLGDEATARGTDSPQR